MLQTLKAHWRLARYDKPIGALLLHLPCVWGVVLGQPSFDFNQIAWYSTVFGVGAFTMRAAGCVVNDMWDRDIDQKVERTKARPLASGELTMKHAWASLFFHCSVGLGVLTQLSWTTIGASFGIVPIAFLYPLAKRYFPYPQLVLGTAFNWGVIVGGLQVAGSVTAPVAWGYLAGVVNTLVYDTIYGHQDKQFDQKLGLYSTAYTLPYYTPHVLSWAFSGMCGLACYAAEYDSICYFLLSFNQIVLFQNIMKTNLENPEECARLFRQFKWYQLTIGIIFGIGSYFKRELQ